MSGPQPPSSQQVKRQKAAGGCRVKVYLHAVTDAQAELLRDVGSKRPLEEISKKTGTDIEFYPYTSPVPGMKIVIIRGVPSQIEMVVRLIRQVTGAQRPVTRMSEMCMARRPKKVGHHCCTGTSAPTMVDEFCVGDLEVMEAHRLMTS